MRRFRYCVLGSGISRQWRLQRLVLHIRNGTWASRTDGFSGGTSSSATTCFDAVFLEIGPVGMTWTGIEVHFRVIVGSLVEVLHEHSYRCPERGIELCA